jgi:hypothetical protein
MLAERFVPHRNNLHAALIRLFERLQLCRALMSKSISNTDRVLFEYHRFFHFLSRVYIADVFGGVPGELIYSDNSCVQNRRELLNAQVKFADLCS